MSRLWGAAGLCWLSLVWSCAGGGASGTGATDVATEPGHTEVETSDCGKSGRLGPDGTCLEAGAFCQPWELPTVQGECLAIGPRGCPVTWNPQSDKTCQSGDYLSCPTGTLASQDGIGCEPDLTANCGANEVSTSSGCVEVGPDWSATSGNQEPFFDDCANGELALPGGGCGQVGPRACPKLWNPETAIDCQEGDLLPCPEGWVTTERTCEPVVDNCPTGERPLFGGGCQSVTVGTCPQGPFPVPPADDSDVLFVLEESACETNCGAISAPYNSIQEAVDNAPDNAYILVGSGTYGGGLHIDHSVHVFGLCPDQVHIEGSVTVASENGGKVETAALAIVDTTDVEIQGFSVSGDGAAVAVVNVPYAVVKNLEIGPAAEVGLYLGSGTDVVMNDVWVHDITPGTEGSLEGEGIWVDDGADLELNGALIEHASLAALYVKHKASSLLLTDSTLRDTQLSSSGFAGYGLRARYGSAVLTDVVLERNSTAGLTCEKDAEIQAQRILIRDGQVDATGTHGMGISVKQGTVEISDSMISGNRYTGVLVMDPEGDVTLTRTTVMNTSPDATGTAGWGVVAAGGSQLTLEGCLVEANQTFNVEIVEEGTNATIRGSLIHSTLSETDGLGQGIVQMLGSNLSIEYSVVEKAKGDGVASFDTGTELYMYRSTVRDTLKSGPMLGTGVSVSDDAIGTLEEILIERSAFIGFSAWGGQETHISMEACLVRKTGDETSPLAPGMHIHTGAVVELRGCKVSDCAAACIVIEEPESEVWLINSVVQGASESPEGMGDGLWVYGGALAELIDSSVTHNARAGIVVEDAGSMVMVKGSLISENGLDATENTQQAGCEVMKGAELHMEETLVAGNQECGLLTAGNGSLAVLEQVNVRDTISPDKLFSMGVFAVEGGVVDATLSIFEGNAHSAITTAFEGHAWLDRCVLSGTVPSGGGDKTATGRAGMAMQGGVLELDYCLAAENTGGGIVAYDTGSEVAIRRSVFREQEFSEVPLGDRGILIGYGASGTVEGSLLDHQPGAALQVTANGSALLVQGTIIRDTLPNAEGLLGYGISATADCGATLAWSCIEGSTTVGAFAWGGSSLVIDHAAVLGTKLGTSGTLQTQTFGDGITSKSSQVSVTGTVLANNARCGLFFVSSQGQLKKTLVRNNASYGLAMLNSIDVVWDELENLISGNCHELPAEFQSTQVTDSPGELPVPDPPSAQPFNLE